MSKLNQCNPLAVLYVYICIFDRSSHEISFALKSITRMNRKFTQQRSEYVKQQSRLLMVV